MSKDNDSAPRDHWTVHLGRAARGLLDEARGVVPDEARTHFRNSRREMLLAVRAVLDERIEDLRPEPKREPRDVEVS